MNASLPAEQSERPSSKWTPSSWLLGLVWGLGGLARLWYLMRGHRPVDFLYSDMQLYVDRAVRLASPGYRPTSGDFFFPAGTSELLSIWIRFLGKDRGLVWAGGFEDKTDKRPFAVR